MSWTATGFGVIPKEKAEITEKQYGNSFYITVNVVDKHYYNPKKREWIKVSIQVPMDDIEEARATLKPGSAFFFRFAEVGGNLLDSGYVATNISTKWRFVEPVKAMPQAGIKNQAESY
jgi:hypothetical protein